MDLLTITAIDQHSSSTSGRTFSTDNADEFKKSVQEFEKELPYKRYELVTEEFIEEYDDQIVKILDELEVQY